MSATSNEGAKTQTAHVSLRHIIQAARTTLFFAPISLLLTWIGSSFYCDDTFLRLLVSGIAAPFLLHAIKRKQADRKLLAAREQYKWFLELLLTELSSGATFEHAFNQTINSLTHMLKERSPFLKSLISLNQQLKAHRPTSELLQRVARRMICPEAGVFFRILPDIQSHGSPVAPFVRQQLQYIVEQLAMHQNLQSDTVQRRTEATILVFMPFLVTGLLNTSWNSASSGEPIVLGRFVACLFALTAGILTLSLSTFALSSKKSDQKTYRSKHQVLRIEKYLSACLYHCYRDLLPVGYGARLLRVIIDLGTTHDLNPDSKSDWTQLFFTQKIHLIIGSMLLAVVIILQMPVLWPLVFLLPLLIAWLQDMKWLNLHQTKLDTISKDYPVLLNLWSALLQTGLSLDRSLRISCEALQFESTTSEKTHLSVQSDLMLIQKHLQAGQSASAVLEILLSDCPIPEIQTALLLLIKYNRLGGTEALQMIQLQSNSLWALHRSAVRHQLQKQSVRLLIPMMMSLIAVLMSALLPAIASLQSF